MKSKKVTNKKLNYFRIISFLLIIVVTSIIYLNSIGNSFHYDDNHTILNNPNIDKWEQFQNVDLWTSLQNNRIIARLTYSLNYALGKEDVFGYHLLNLVIHIINALLAYLLSLIIIKSVIKNDEKKSLLFALFIGLLFAVHPLQTEAVTYITQRMASLAAMFYMLGCLFYIKGRTEQNQLRIKTFLYYFITAVCFPLAIWSKENAFTLPLMIFFIELFFIRDESGKLNQKLIFVFLFVILTALIYAIFFKVWPTMTEEMSSSEYLITEFRAYLKYFSLFVFPINQRIFYNFPISKSFFEPDVIFSFSVLLIIFFFVFYSFRQHKIISFGFVWFFTAMLVESSFFPLQFPFCEYRMYLPIFGLLITTNYLFFFVLFKTETKKPIIILSLFVVFLMYLTIQRNYVWKDGISLWSDNIEKEPEAAEPYNYLGYYYVSNSMFAEAFPLFNKAIELKNTLGVAYNNRGWAYFKTGNFQNALSDFTNAIKFDTLNFLAYNNRGSALASLGKTDEALVSFKQSSSIMNSYPNAYYNIGNCYFIQNKLDSALFFFNKAIELNPYYGVAFNNRGVVQLRKNNYEKANNDFEKAIELKSEYFEAFNNLAICFRELKNYDMAIQFHNRSLSINPNYSEAFYHRGLTYYKIGRTDLAKQDLFSAQSVNPNNKKIQEFLNLLMDSKLKNNNR